MSVGTAQDVVDSRPTASPQGEAASNRQADKPFLDANTTAQAEAARRLWPRIVERYALISSLQLAVLHVLVKAASDTRALPALQWCAHHSGAQAWIQHAQ